MKHREIIEALASMEPQAAAEFLRPALTSVLGHFDDEGKTNFLLSLFGPSQQDKTASMVHL